VRPKPEFGTAEIRVCDTPLTVEKACQLAAFAQALGATLADEPMPDRKAWMAYRTNRFQATRFGLHGHYVDPQAGRVRLGDHVRMTFDKVMPAARELGTAEMLEALRADVFKHGGDVKWLRAQFDRSQEIAEVVEAAAAAWRGEGTAETKPEPSVPDLQIRRRVRASSEPIFNMDGITPFGFKRLGRRLH